VVAVSLISAHGSSMLQAKTWIETLNRSVPCRTIESMEQAP
jgi:hypothetical protein